MLSNVVPTISVQVLALFPLVPTANRLLLSLNSNNLLLDAVAKLMISCVEFEALVLIQASNVILVPGNGDEAYTLSFVPSKAKAFPGTGYLVIVTV